MIPSDDGPSNYAMTIRDAITTGFMMKLTPGSTKFFSKPGGDATLLDLPIKILVSEQRSRQIDGREPKQFLHDALPRAQFFLDKNVVLDRCGNIRSYRLTASVSYTSADAG
jgi:hypothetical protein